MIYQIIVPKEKTYQLEIPQSFIGKKIKLLAFEIEDSGKESLSASSSINDLFEKFDGLTFDSKEQFVFNREDATDYE